MKTSCPRIAIPGTQGQVARALIERAVAREVEIVAIGRPQLDLAVPRTVAPAIAAAAPDLVVNTAAYTDTERAEALPDEVEAINAHGAGVLAQCTRALGIPIIQLSTDYVFDGAKETPYRETDAVGPLNVYGRSKLRGELAVAAANPNHVILRTAWVYSPFGRNFVLAMLRLAGRQDEVRVVADQRGNPTAAMDVADGILTVARNLLRGDRDDRGLGIFHMAGAGTATWLELAEAVFALSAARGGPHARVVPITMAEYSTRVQRPASTALDCSKIAAAHGVTLPSWQTSLPGCVARVLEQER